MNQNHLYPFGASEQVLLNASIKKPLLLGRISKHFKDRYSLLYEQGSIEARVSGKWMHHTDDHALYPTVGDFVLFELKDDLAIITELIPRKSAIERKVAGLRSDRQVIAANVDFVFICQSVNEDFNLRRLERYLSMVWSSGATPVILLTKTDLVSSLDSYILAVSDIAVGVEILTSSNQLIKGYQSLEQFLQPNQTYAFIGSSGVGKSSIINYLLKDNIMDTKAIGYLDRGRHTTTYRSLFVTANQWIIIDTPGMREIQLEQADFDNSFGDIALLSKGCKFKDCMHEHEPGCNVLLAIEKGELDPLRLKNYMKMKKELAYAQKRQMFLEKQRNKGNRKLNQK